MAGSATVTTNTFGKAVSGRKKILRVKYAWTSHTDGAVLASENDKPPNDVTGKIVGVKSEPGTVAETFTFTIVDNVNVMDVLQGTCVDPVMSNTDTANENLRYPVTANEGAPIYLVSETLSLVIASAGSGKTGTVYLYVELP